jgi:hypothetical protein
MGNQSVARASNRQRLEREWLKPAGRSLCDPLVVKALDRLATEVDVLVAAGSGWVTRDMPRLGDIGNYQSYCLEVHIAAGFRANGVTLRHDVRLQQPDNNSDVDFVYHEPPRPSYNFEVVCVNDWDKSWEEVAAGAGVTLFSGYWDESEEGQQHLRLQDKLRIKTLDKKKNAAWKFPEPTPGCVNILVADVSGIWLGEDPDYWDLMLLTHGRGAVPCINRRQITHDREGVALEKPRQVLGMLEQSNALGDDYNAEFESNRHFRERVHATIFLMDQTRLRSSLDPDYEALIIPNWALIDEKLASEIGSCLQLHFRPWIDKWLAEPSDAEELGAL